MHNRPRPAPGAPRDARKEAAQAQRLALYQKLAAKARPARAPAPRAVATCNRNYVRIHDPCPFFQPTRSLA